MRKKANQPAACSYRDWLWIVDKRRCEEQFDAALRDIPLEADAVVAAPAAVAASTASTADSPTCDVSLASANDASSATDASAEAHDPEQVLMAAFCRALVATSDDDLPMVPPLLGESPRRLTARTVAVDVLHRSSAGTPTRRHPC